jgi:hypothetical protein
MGTKYLKSHCPACGRRHRQAQQPNWGFKSYQGGPILMMTVCFRCVGEAQTDTQAVADRIDAFMVKHGAVKANVQA